MKRSGLSTEPFKKIGKIRRKQKRSKEGIASGIGREPRENNEVTEMRIEMTNDFSMVQLRP